MESFVVTCIDVCLITFLQYFALLAVPMFHVGLSEQCSVLRDTTIKALRQWSAQRSQQDLQMSSSASY